MKTKRITGFVALALFAVAIALPLGLTGQTNDVGRVSLGGGPAAQPVSMSMPAPSPQMPGMPSYMVAEPSVAAYGTPDMPQYYGPGSGVGFNMSDPTSSNLFGPQYTFDANMREGLGFSEDYFRLNAQIPWHLVPGQTVMLFDIAGGSTSESGGMWSGGVAYRNYDAARDRIFGINAFYDWDRGTQRDDGYQRLTFGFESLGKYIDFTANGYYVLGTDEEVISSQLTGDCSFIGHNIIATRERRIETAFSGFDAEAGGPLPFLGHWGFSGYVGAYYLDNETAGDTLGFSGRVQAHINDATVANLTYTNDDLLGDTAWGSLSVTLPRWRTRGWFKQRVTRERLGDQIRRSTRVHTNVATYRNAEAVINPLDGRPFELLYVNPNQAANGDGSVENPFNNLESLAAANAGNFDVLSVAPRLDNTSTNLSVAGGLDLFPGQQLLGRTKSHLIFDNDEVICHLPSLHSEDANGNGRLDPGEDANLNGALDFNPDILDPLITNPVGGPGSYVVSLTDNNTVSGLRIDANGGRGIVSRRPLRDFTITCNTIFNHTDGVVLNNVRGNGVFSDNVIDGEDEDGNATANNGLLLSVAAGERLDLLIENNRREVENDDGTFSTVGIQGHTGDGIRLLARPGSRIQANDPNGELGPRTGILGNMTNNNGRGINIEARAGAVVNASVEDNEFSENARDGFLALSDGGRVVFRSFARNTGLNNGGNGVFFHYRNGGEFFVLSEDANQNGIRDAGEDVNGNAAFDLGFVQNDLSGNGENGLCIFGQGSGLGRFDIGGPDSTLGNRFIGNADGGIALDLTGTARGQIDALFNTFGGGTGITDPASLTIVLDFISAGQGTITDAFGTPMTPFDPTTFGFAATDVTLIGDAVRDVITSTFHDIPTSDVDARSPIPPGMQLDIDFIVGDVNTDPGFGNEYYTLLLGDDSDGSGGGAAGRAFLSSIRDATGAGPTPAGNFTGALGDSPASLYTNVVNGLSPGLNPPDALTSGNLTFTSDAIGLIAAHEVGHALSLNHVLVAGAVGPTGANPVMATPALDSTIQSVLEPREFVFDGTLGDTGPGQQMSVQQLVNAVGLRDAPVAGGSQRDGVRIRASNNARLEASRILNNDISNQTENGVSIVMNDNAKAEDVDIQGNTITGSGRGINLEARGANAMIFADQTIGGVGTNSLGGVSRSQSNIIRGNSGDGLRVLAADGGMIQGNAINNVIENNDGNGIALLIERYGTLDFGDTSFGENRIVQGNTIDGNGGFGILARSDSTPGEITTLKLITEGNTISNNASGGLFADVRGTNSTPPAVPAPLVNSTLDLTIMNEVFEDNGDVGVAVSTAGNTKANVLIQDSTITGTTVPTGGGAFGGDGINLQRRDASLLTAEVFSNDVSGNGGDGMSVVYAGNNRFDATQPMTGTINTVTWEGNLFNANGANGVSFEGRGDGQLIADGTNNTISNNASNGILVDTREFSTFGDPSDVAFPPPGRRTVFTSNRIQDNGNDGVQLVSEDNSRQLIHITSASSSEAASPHVSGPTDGDTVISGNAGDGVHILSQDDSDIDVLIDSGDGNTVIANNGNNGAGLGGNGIRFDAGDNSSPTLNVRDITISGSIAGGTEDVNGNDVLDGVEDTTGNLAFVDDNLDIDVQNGDGIQANFTGNTTATLQVGGVNAGNHIHSNEDDGIAITARGGDGTGVPRPVINIQENVVGGFSDGQPVGNGGDGLSINVVGGQGIAGLPNQFDNGPIITATIEQNEFSQNLRIGANFRLTGAGGVRNRELGTDPTDVDLDLGLIRFNDNLVRSNGRDGVYYQANTNFLENRQVFLFSNDTGDPTDNNDLEPPYSPASPEFIGLNFGTLNGNAAYMAPYLNLRTAQNSMFEALRNEVTGNGTSLVMDQGTGMTIRVSPNAYVAADVRDNTFGGNLDADLFTESFNVSGNPLNSIDNDDGTALFDEFFLDDTAQLDLRFDNNTGNQIEVTSFGAQFTNFDIGKGFGSAIRDVALFQIDNGPFLNNPNNVFSFQGSIQDIRSAFSTGGYNERAAADPQFPNIAFPPPLP